MKPLVWTGLTTGTLLLMGSVLAAGQWLQLQDDGLHDPANPSLSLLQEPAEALGVLSPDTAGNRVNWVTALQSGQIAPRASLRGDIEPEILELDIVMTATLPLPHVIFRHKPHTEWMDCATCHEEIFASETGANVINMSRILEGESCGVCHGAVSFPLTECNRCHSVIPEDTIMAPPSGGIRVPEQ